MTTGTTGRPLRVGIIGCGNVALGFHLPAYQALPEVYEVVGLVDPTPERLELGRVAAGLTDAQIHAEASELLVRDDIDVVDVCTPQHLHREVVVAAAAAGKHVLCEKPVAATPEDAAAMVAAAEHHGVVLGVVHNYLFFPEVRALRALVDSGELGAIRTVTVDMLGVVDSPGAAGYQPLWRKDPAVSGGGVLMDMLHGVYLAEHLLTEPIEAVSARVESAGDGAAVEGLALCRMDGAHGTALVNVGWGHGQGGIAVHGTRGRAVARYRADGTMPWAPFESLRVTTEAGSRILEVPPGEELVPLVANAMRDTVADLAQAITTGNAPAADGSVARRILEATIAAYASAALRRAVDLPLPVDGPLHRRGVVGLTDLDVPAGSPLRPLRLFGLTPTGA